MPAPNISPSPRPRRGTSLVVRVALGVVLLSAIVAFAAAFRSALDEPVYTFSCDGLTDPAEVRKLLRFADDGERLRRWTPDTASDAAVEALGEHLRGGRAERWADLYRSGTAPGLATLNGAVALLAARLPDAELPRLRELPPDRLRARVRVELDAAVAGQRAEAVRERLRAPDLEPLLARLGDKPYPQEPSSWRRWVCCAWGRPVRDRERWTEALLNAIAAARPELTRVVERYERVARLDEVPLAATGRPGLLLRRLSYAEPTLHALRWERERTTADWAVWHRAAGAAGSWIERDTGVRLHGVPFTVGDEPRPAWPPPTALAADAEFLAFLHALGFPAALTVRADEVHGEGAAENPTLVVDITARSADFRDWRWRGRLRLGDDLGSAVVEMGRQALAGLRDHVPHATAYRGLPARFEPVGKDSETLTARLEVASAPALRLRCRLNEGSLSWLGPDNLRDEAALAAWLAARHKELAPFTGHLVLGRVEPLGTALEGTLTVSSGTAPPVAWRLGMDGEPTFQIPEGWSDAVRRVGGLTATKPERAEEFRDALEEQLRQRYPLLARHAEVVASAVGLCFVGVRIDDWPLLRLGPARADEPAGARAALGRLLAEDSVRRAAAAQWDAVRHARYGPVRPDISGWSADDAHATIHCVAPLWPEAGADLAVAWNEKTWLNLDGWQRDTVDIPKQIAKARDALLEKVNQYLGKSIGPSDYLLTVEPDTTDGPFAWLSLKPFSIKLRARLRVKPFDLVVVMGGARLDCGGLHMPDDYHLTLERTLPTPYCALSDPTLRVHLKRQSLALGCKVTPPVLPILAAGKGVRPTAEQVRKVYGLPKALPLLRLDNPWLHLIYLRGEFGGQLREHQLHAQADLRLLEFVDAAHGSAVLIPGEYRLEARLRAGTPLNSRVGLPVSLDGEALFTPAVSRLQGKVRLTGLGAADATFRILTQESPARLRLDVGAEVPVLGRAHLLGESDLAFTTYRLRGEGRLTAAWLRGEELHYVIEVRDGRTIVDFRREKAGKAATVRVEAPDPAALDEAIVRERLQRLTEEAPIRAASPTEIQVAARLADTELTPLPSEPPEDELVRVALRPASATPASSGGALRPVANVECIDPGGPIFQFRYYDEHGDPKDAGNALKLKVPFTDPKRCVFRSWIDPNQPPYFKATVVFDTQHKQVTLLRYENGRVTTATDLTERFASLGVLFPSGSDAVGRAEMVQDFIAAHTDLTLRGNRIVGDVRRVGDGFLLEYEPKGLPDRLNAVFTWRAGGSVCTARLFEPAVPRARRDGGLYARLETLRPGRRNLLVVAVEDGPAGRIATLEPAGAGTWELRPEAKATKLTLKEADGPTPPTAELAHRVAVAVWRHGLPTQQTQAVLVPGGALVWTEKGFWLLPAPALLDRDAPFYLTWDAFRRWDSDSIRLLHPDWRSPKARAAATPELIARVFLRDWTAVRDKEPGWAANPLGLLIGLAERKREVALDR